MTESDAWSLAEVIRKLCAEKDCQIHRDRIFDKSGKLREISFEVQIKVDN